MKILEKAYTFDDVLLVPAASSVLPREVKLSARLSRHLNLKIPLISAAMDTVTEAKLAISMAQEGGIGICLLYTSPSPRDLSTSRMPSSA